MPECPTMLSEMETGWLWDGGDKGKGSQRFDQFFLSSPEDIFVIAFCFREQRKEREREREREGNINWFPLVCTPTRD